MSDSLYNRLQELSESDLYSFHMPGHKRLFPDKSGWYALDISEITGFDYLHSPESILLNAQKKAAELYQADESFYLINGSTAGILSAISAVSNAKKLLISRNSHFSVYHAVYLNNLALAYIYPRYDKTGIAYGITVEEVRDKFEKDPDIGVVLITSPTYEGISSDIPGIAKIVRDNGACLIIDQAHGAHFGFHPAFPENAVKQGADIVIHSLHKTLPALTQTALLHVNGERINRNRLKRFLRIYQSSSPSYPLMAGIERCLDFIKNEGKEALEKMLEMRDALTDQVSQSKQFKILPKTEANREAQTTENPDKLTTDPCKLIILTKGISGIELARILREKYLLEMEMATDKYVTAIITMMDKSEGFNRLADALKEVDNQIPLTNEKEEINPYPPYAPEIIMNIKEAYDGDRIEVPVNETEGKVAAEFAYSYPPGIPIIVPGEKVDSHIISMLKKQGDTFWILR